MSRRAGWTGWAFLAPGVGLYCLYILFPVLFSVYLSFTNWDGLSASVLPLCWNTEVSCFRNFTELFRDPVFWICFKNNLVWLFFFSLSAPLGLILALLFHVQGRAAKIYKSLFFMPMVFSLVVVATIWGWFLQPQFGLVDVVLHYVGILKPDEQFGMMASFQWATAGLILTAAWPHTSYCMILYLAGLSNLQANVLDAANMEGCNFRQLLWHIVLPMLRPATVVVTIVTMIGSLRAFDLVALMTAGGPANSSNVLALYMYQQTFENFRYGYGAAVATILLCMSLFLIFFYLRKTLAADPK